MNFGENSDFFKPKPLALSGETPGPADFTSLFTDARDFVVDMFKQISTNAKTTTLGASFMENASQIIGLAVLMLGIALYVQIKSVQDLNIDAAPDKYSTSIVDTGDRDNIVSKKVSLELFSNNGGKNDEDPNPHAPPKLANRDGSTIKNVTNGKIDLSDIITDSISTMIPPGPSDAVRSKLKDVSRACNTTNEFCKHNQADLQKACGDITTQNSCAQKCCCGWVKFSGGSSSSSSSPSSSSSSSSVVSDARSTALNGFGISPDGKCVAGSADGPELTFNKDIDYYYYMGECMNGVCKSKGT
jgi:hypothetical protein